MVDSRLWTFEGRLDSKTPLVQLLEPGARRSQPPCKEVCLSAFDIEEYVRSTLSSGNWDNTNESNQGEADQFTKTWMSLDEQAQRRMLPSIVDQVVFESERGTVSVKLVANLTDKLSR